MWKVSPFLLRPPWLPFLTQRDRADVLSLYQYFGLIHKTHGMFAEFPLDTKVTITVILTPFLFNYPPDDRIWTNSSKFVATEGSCLKAILFLAKFLNYPILYWSSEQPTEQQGEFYNLEFC